MKGLAFFLAALSLNLMSLCFIPEIEPDESALQAPFCFDFGVTHPGTTRRVTFRLVNNYANAITLGQVRASCGCLATHKPDKPIESGETFEVTIDLRPFYQERDAHEKVLIPLEGVPAAFIRFGVTAAVRRPVSPQVGSSGRATIVAVDSNESASIRVLNYSGRHWKKLDAYGPPSLGITSTIVTKVQPNNLKYGEPIECWRLDFSIEHAKEITSRISQDILIFATPVGEPALLPVKVSLDILPG
jgi:hypothetical protein